MCFYRNNMNLCCIPRGSGTVGFSGASVTPVGSRTPQVFTLC